MTILSPIYRTMPNATSAFLRAMLARIHLRLVRAVRKQAASEHADCDPWTSAVDAVAGLDQHTLRDIGAPAWLMAEVRHRQSLAAKRLLDLHIR
jgi:hypothetical protein